MITILNEYWFSSDSQCGWTDVIQRVAASDRGITGIDYVCGDTICHVSSKDKDMEIIRARLISASPELYKAINAAHFFISHLPASKDYDKNIILKQIEDTINKVEGKNG